MAEAQTLKDLVLAAQAGDAGAKGELLQRHLPWLRAVLRLEADPAVRQKESCSDLAQSVFLEVLQNLHRFEYRDDAGFRSWLYSWVKNKVRNKRRYYLARKRDSHREALPPGSAAGWDEALSQVYATFTTPSEELALRERIARVEAAFDRLPEDHRRVILLSFFIKLPHAEIAEEMGRSELAVRSLLHRALAKLSTLLTSARTTPLEPGS